MTLQVQCRGEVCELHLDAPPGNILDRTLCLDMAAAVREHARDPHLKAFLITAAGKHFSFGASVPEHAAGEVERFLPAFHGVFLAFAEAGVPTVASVRGLCLGGGFELAAFCNLLVAESTAEFAAPEIMLGVFPPAACVILPWRIGGAAAEDLILTGRRMSAAEGVRRGLVSRVCAGGALEGTVEALLDSEIRTRSAAALRLAVKAARGPLYALLRERLGELERLYLGELMDTRDAHEGIRAFLEKRDPVWVDA